MYKQVIAGRSIEPPDEVIEIFLSNRVTVVAGPDLGEPDVKKGTSSDSSRSRDAPPGCEKTTVGKMQSRKIIIRGITFAPKLV